MTEPELKAQIEALLPADGMFHFRAFDIPQNAGGYRVGPGGYTPLRCWPGDVRVGIAIFDHKGIAIQQAAIETAGAEALDDKTVASLRHVIDLLVQAVADNRDIEGGEQKPKVYLAEPTLEGETR
jgi:hypothetical protein